MSEPDYNDDTVLWNESVKTTKIIAKEKSIEYSEDQAIIVYEILKQLRIIEKHYMN